MREPLNSETPIFDFTTNLGGTGVNHTCQIELLQIMSSTHLTI